MASAKDKVIDTVHDWITSGRYQPGELLPTEQELTTLLGVSRGTVRTGLKTLEETRLIDRVRGRGCVVAMTVKQTTTLLSDTVIVLVKNQSDPFDYQNTGYMKAVEASTIDTLMQQGLHVFSMQEPVIQEERIERFLDTMPRGIIVMEDFIQTEKGRHILSMIQQRGIHVVINSNIPEVSACDRVISDSETGAYQLTRHLIDKGCKTILRLWPENSSCFWLQDRDAGYERAMKEAHLDILPCFHLAAKFAPPPYSAQEDKFQNRVRYFAGFLIELLAGNARPDAILAKSDWDIPVLNAACRLLNVEPGRDILLAGYDDKWDTCSWRQYDPVPPVATIDKQNVLMGRQLVQMLLDRSEQKLPDAPQLLKVMPNLKVYDSK